MKINNKLVDKILNTSEYALLCIKNTYTNLEERKRVIDILNKNGYLLKFKNSTYFDEDVTYISLNYPEYTEEEKIIQIDYIYISNTMLRKYVEKATLTTPIECYGYNIFACDKIEDLMINKEELE